MINTTALNKIATNIKVEPFGFIHFIQIIGAFYDFSFFLYMSSVGNELFKAFKKIENHPSIPKMPPRHEIAPMIDA